MIVGMFNAAAEEREINHMLEEKMSLDKAIEHGKEHRKPYYRSARFDRTCRPGGTCEYCRGNRLHKHERRKPIQEDYE